MLLHYVHRFYKKSHKGTVWYDECFYLSTTMHKIPNSVRVPDSVVSEAKIFFSAMETENLKNLMTVDFPKTPITNNFESQKK